MQKDKCGRGMISELILISSDEYDSLSPSSSPQPLPPPFKTSKCVPFLMEDSPTKCEDSSDKTTRMTLLIYLHNVHCK